MNAKIPSTLYRKVLLIFVQLLHTNTRDMYTSQSVCASALPSHRPSRPTVQLPLSFYFLDKELNPKARAGCRCGRVELVLQVAFRAAFVSGFQVKWGRRASSTLGKFRNGP